ncbi:transposase IS204/IS1001/IS1096/IS1165 family protein [Alkalithermobacter thermoalcaliphilus JW-YL-7 = DSM 7308]|uniref:Transposase IS204/IS1001/IS1096/IS1165 family protein n=4 Tax=Alkalithermobacter thermoalcaliphilus JW-YL-7 = DSM 7308 TaxID=1121328 RepID=A0A150FQD9_CLOPD|nr:transposase IS204/IS1001/IS1096/IS1165 family protein [[Clostridium] paradoxum JW-YL-7 = DSM 7308]
MHSNFINKLLNLQGVKINKISHEDSFIKIYIKTNPREHTCPACGCLTSRVHDYRNQLIKDLPLQFKHVFLVLRKRRYVCSCGKRFYEHYDFLPRYNRMTKRLVYYICNELTKVTSMTSIAKSANVSVSTVTRIFNYVNYSIPTLPKVLCIDEFKGNAETGRYQCILVDGEKNKVLDILADRSQNHLISYFNKFSRKERCNVQFFVCDMWQPYTDLAKIYFPNAKIIIDKYHFIRQVTWAIENVRKRIQKNMPLNLRKYYKRSRKLILTRYHKLQDENKKAVDLMLLYNDDLRVAHKLKEWFYEICQSNNYSYQSDALINWIKNAESSKIEEFEKCAATYRRWVNEIRNAFK